VASTPIDFNVPDIAARAEEISQFELDRLPFGVILLDREDKVLFYSQTEAKLSGYGDIPIGQNLYKRWSCFDCDDFRGRIERARESGPLDIELGWSGARSEMRIRVQSSRKGGMWIFIERD
jgi:photoactive yellow protein